MDPLTGGFYLFIASRTVRTVGFDTQLVVAKRLQPEPSPVLPSGLGRAAHHSGAEPGESQGDVGGGEGSGALSSAAFLFAATWECLVFRPCPELEP